ncbi:RagB/SusD family nutrient uptake outer membrane protein [Sinomicrobium pectinilyticum]|uniref:RagB/SusD family nutrient uptake outer membrane protein n=1 Tax=Sinomicrobium pectinilyticum TaxID=1084421 RepID=A0A3N0CYU4_SINP1|nr:RagB/SusD family nutrient uptake outer membrane protein [Sinomicrobium pectinilyticum]RNL68597.1 RagB/SusD family nutrient uptake outer membrane protein [Sinomicrobium pectinilyticum]
MNMYKFIVVVFVASVFTCCNDFLEEPPSKTSSVVPETVEDLESLLNNYNFFAAEPSQEQVFGTDDYGLFTELYDSRPGLFHIFQLQYATWERKDVANGKIAYWESEWKKIFTANLVLFYLPRVSGSEDRKQQLKAEARFIRVYSYFQLANVYCLPYTEANWEEPGLPIKETTGFEEPVARATLKETWDFIDANLTEALTLTTSLEEVNNKKRTWRASQAAVYAFAARYYLVLYDYARAQQYAEKALGIYNRLRNYNTEMRYSDIVYEVTIFDPDTTTIRLKYPYTHSFVAGTAPTDLLEWGEFYYLRYSDDISDNFPSRELLALYDHTYDLRYKYHIVEHYSYHRGFIDPPYSYPGYVFFDFSKIPNGPSVPEMILTKAECQIRQGAWQEGIQTLNELREARMNADAPAGVKYLSAASQQEAVVKLTEERRREMPFVTRWFDVRRYNNNDDPSDDVVMTRTFYPYNASTILDHESPVHYTLEKHSRKFACPIPNADIMASNGVLKQNEY